MWSNFVKVVTFQNTAPPPPKSPPPPPVSRNPKQSAWCSNPAPESGPHTPGISDELLFQDIEVLPDSDARSPRSARRKSSGSALFGDCDVVQPEQQRATYTLSHSPVSIGFKNDSREQLSSPKQSISRVQAPSSAPKRREIVLPSSEKKSKEVESGLAAAPPTLPCGGSNTPGTEREEGQIMVGQEEEQTAAITERGEDITPIMAGSEEGPITITEREDPLAKLRGGKMACSLSPVPEIESKERDNSSDSDPGPGPNGEGEDAEENHLSE